MQSLEKQGRGEDGEFSSPRFEVLEESSTSEDPDDDLLDQIAEASDA